MAGEKGKKNEAVLATNTSELLQVPCGGRVLEGLGAFVVFFLPHVPFEASYYEFILLQTARNGEKYHKCVD